MLKKASSREPRCLINCNGSIAALHIMAIYVLFHMAWARPAAADDCAYLPVSPTPSWIHKLPDLPDAYLGVGSASRHASPEEQLQASADAALAALAAGIQVYVKGSTLEIETVSGNKESIEISSHTESSVKQLLRDAKVESRWLDQKNCILWTLASVPKGVVQSVLARRVMLFDVAPAHELAPIAQWLQTQLEQLFRNLGTTTTQSDLRLVACASGEFTSPCHEHPNIIFAGYSVVLEKEKLSTDGMYKGRYLRLRGALHQQARLISSFDVTCYGTGKISQDTGQIDQQAASDCLRKARKILQEDLQKLS